MAVLAKDDNELMVDMTKRSMADARTLKTITILTLIYLPASFVSVGDDNFSSSKKIGADLV